MSILNPHMMGSMIGYGNLRLSMEGLLAKFTHPEMTDSNGLSAKKPQRGGLVNREFHYDRIFYGHDSDYLYGAEGLNVVRQNSSGAVSVGFDVTLIGSNYLIQSIFCTSTDDLIFLVAYDSTSSKFSLFKSVDGGASFGANSPLFNDTNPVMLFGDTDGTEANQITDVRSLGTRSFCEVTIEGSTVYLVGEYNVNTARIPGSTNDQVRLMRSDDLGTTWTEAAHWNTDGLNNNTRHFHVIKQDFATGLIYLGFGDSDTQSGIIRWDGVSSIPVNQNITTYTTGTFMSIGGSQRHRVGDILFTDSKLFLSADTTVTGERGIWRCDKDLTNYELSNNSVVNYDGGWASLAGVTLSTGEMIFSLFRESASTDSQTRLWLSQDKGETWSDKCKVGFNVAAGGGFFKGFFEWNGLVYASSDKLAAHLSGGGTIAFVVGESNNDESIVHPVWYVTKNGDNANNGYSVAKSWSTLERALEGNSICRGGAVIIGAGDYTESLIYPLVKNGGHATGGTLIQGAGKEVTSIHGGTSVALFFIDSNCVEPITISGFTAFATENGATITMGVGSPDVLITDSVIGDEVSNSPYGIRIGDGNIKARRTIFKKPPATGRNIWLNGENTVAIFDFCVSMGGMYGINYEAASQLNVKSMVFYNYSTQGIVIAPSAINVPIVKNSAFKTTYSAYAIRDFAELAETDTEIDYNCYGSATIGLANSGGSHSIATDPLFVDPENGDFTLQASSPCIGTGIDVFVDGDGDQYDADGYMVWSDTFNAPVYHWRDGVDIGAYAYGGGSKVKNNPTIISGDSMANYVLELPICPTLYDFDDGSIYTGIVPNQINLATFVDTDQMRWGSKYGVFYSTAQDEATIVKIDKYIGNV